MKIREGFLRRKKFGCSKKKSCKKKKKVNCEMFIFLMMLLFWKFIHIKNVTITIYISFLIQCRRCHFPFAFLISHYNKWKFRFSNASSTTQLQRFHKLSFHCWRKARKSTLGLKRNEIKYLKCLFSKKFVGVENF
jgi:hypothetical protein